MIISNEQKTFNMDERNINTIGLGASILLTSLGVYFIGKSILNQIRAKAEDKIDDNLTNEIVTGGGGSTNQQALEIEQAKLYNPYQDVLALRRMLEGWNFAIYDKEVTAIVMKLTDAKLRKLATYYKGATKGTSLYAQLKGEWGYVDGTAYDAVERRLNLLGLR